LAVDEDQADVFGNDLQQLVQDPTDRPALKNTRLRPRTNGRVVVLSHEIQECGSVNKKKKKSKISFNNNSSNQEMEGEKASFFDAVSYHPSEHDPSINSDPDTNPDPDTDPDTNPYSNPGVGDSVDDDSSPNSGVNDDNPTGLGNSFNPDGYWGINTHSTCEYVLNTIASFTNFQASNQHHYMVLTGG
jgi:hypothetical protein